MLYFSVCGHTFDLLNYQPALLTCTTSVSISCAPLFGVQVENVASGIDCYSIRQPLGVCAGICPFNFPAMVPLWMFPLAGRLVKPLFSGCVWYNAELVWRVA